MAKVRPGARGSTITGANLASAATRVSHPS